MGQSDQRWSLSGPMGWVGEPVVEVSAYILGEVSVHLCAVDKEWKMKRMREEYG